MSRCAPVALLLPAVLAVHLPAQPLPASASGDATATMEMFLTSAAQPHQYRAWRRLEASGSGQQGWLEVQTTFMPSSGLRYEITAEGGSRIIRTRVLRSLLDEEQRLIASGRSGDVALSPDNYSFASAGFDANGLAAVQLTPRRRERSLIVGTMFLSPQEGDLVRVEGRLAKSPSFWLSWVSVVRSYQRVNGVVMPVSLESIGKLRLLGRSTMRMTYRYLEIDERPVLSDSTI